MRRPRHILICALCAITGGCSGTFSETKEGRDWRHKQASDTVREASTTSHTSAKPIPVPMTANFGGEAATRPTGGGPAAGGAAGAGARAGAVAGSRRVLMVNDESITIEDVLTPLRDRLASASRSLSRDDYYELLINTVRRQIIGEVAERLVWRDTTRDMDDNRKKALDAAVDRMERDRINREFGGREPRYEEALARQGRTREQAREKLKRAIMVQEYLRQKLMPQVSVNRKELAKYYEEHPIEFRKNPRVEMFIIDIPYQKMFPERELRDPNVVRIARKVARERLDEAKKRLDAGDAFESVAKRFSKGDTADAGGHFGFITEPLQHEYEAPSRQALKMNPGEVSGVMESDKSVYIVKVARVESTQVVSFESAQVEIMNKLREQKLAELESHYLRDLAERSALGQLEPFVRAVVEAAPDSPLAQR